MSAPKRKPRIAVVATIDLAIENLLRPQIHALQGAGYDVLGVCAPGPYVDMVRSHGIPVATVPIERRVNPLADLAAVRELARLFRRERIDIVHTHTTKGNLLGQLAGRVAGVPLRLVTVHGLYSVALPPGPARTLYRRLETASCRMAHHVFSQSAEDCRTMVRQGMLPQWKIEWIGNGIDLERFNPERLGTLPREEVRREHGIPAGAFVFGVVARMVREKGLDELFQALASLRNQGVDAWLLHVGFIDPSYGDELSPERAKDHGIAEFCRFAGQRQDMERMLPAMDAFVLPSWREGYPRSVMEANAMGLPAIVTDIRGCREAVVDGENGLLVPLRDPGALATAMRRLHDDPALRARLSRGARERARTTFDERRVCRTILAAYERLGRRTGLGQDHD